MHNRGGWNRPLALLAMTTLTALLLLAACTPETEATATREPPSGPPPSMPYIFEGNFTVDGEPGPAGLSIFARIGDAHSFPPAKTLDGRYNNIIVGPVYTSDLEHDVTFHLGELDGDSVQAEETFPFEPVGSIANFEFDLSFPSLP